MKTTTSQRVTDLRTRLKLSQAEFAAALGMTATGIWKIEQGETNPRTSTLAAICEKFNVDRDWLIAGKGELRFVSETASRGRSQENPWQDALVKSLQDRVNFYEEILRNLTGKQVANFNEAAGLAGFFEELSGGSDEWQEAA